VNAVALRAQLLRNEALKVTYSYWDGTGHRRHTTVRKGDTIGAFLSAVREQLSPEFRDLRCARPRSARPGATGPGLRSLLGAATLQDVRMLPVCTGCV